MLVYQRVPWVSTCEKTHLEYRIDQTTLLDILQNEDFDPWNALVLVVSLVFQVPTHSRSMLIY
jgi:hypothetical protein